MKPVQYDRKVIEEFAGRLYVRARSIILQYTIFGALLGIVVAFGLAALIGARTGESTGFGLGEGGLVGLLGAIPGYFYGREKAFALKLQAQVALCQAEIERNTRAGVESTAARPVAA